MLQGKMLWTLFTFVCFLAGVYAVDVTGISISASLSVLKSGEVSCAEFIDAYLSRIEAYDRNGPALISLITISPRKYIDEKVSLLDNHLATTGQLYGKLHCSPILAKDCYDHVQFPTTAGSAAFLECYPRFTSPVIEQLEAEGAIMLAKTNLPDFTVGNSTFMSSTSTVIGATKNAYVASRSPYGSSGGTGASIAASLGLVGLGADTQGSIQLPASCEGMIGLRPTQGLVSGRNEFPLVIPQDSNGPISQHVSDVASILEIMVDPAVVTDKHLNAKYTDYLNVDGLRGKRIGFSRDVFATLAIKDKVILEPDSSVVKVVEEALVAMAASGAVIVDNVNVSLPISRYLNGNGENTTLCGQAWNRQGISMYLEENLLESCPIKTVQDIIDTGLYPVGDITRQWLDDFVDYPLTPGEDPACTSYEDMKTQAHDMLLDIMAHNEVDYILYPTMNRLPTTITPDPTDPVNLPITYLSASTRLPALVFPVGYGDDGIPISLSLTGEKYSEGRLIEIAYGYEQQIFKNMKTLPTDYPPV